MKKLTRGSLGAGLALAVLTTGATAATAADVTDNPDFVTTIELIDFDDWTLQTGPFAWEDMVLGVLDADDPMATFPIPAGATNAWVFIAPVGQESDPEMWSAKSVQDLAPGNIFVPNFSIEAQTTPAGGTPNGLPALKAAGGDYSLGLGFTKDNGVNLIPDSLYFAHITITPGTGAWTFTAVTNGEEPPAGDEVEGSPAVQNLSAEVAAADGLLSLVAPSATSSTIGNPTIVGGKSTSTGTLGGFAVVDARNATKPGWTLTTTSVGDFVNGATTIGKANLGLAPRNAGGVAATLGSAQVPGSATYPSLFAEMAQGTAGTTNLDADLTFVAPEGSPAGTYTSTLTLTLVSK